MTATELDVSSFAHCGELHERIGLLLKMLSDKMEVQIVECARCGKLLISQYESKIHGSQNYIADSMEICPVCIEALHDKKRTDHLEEQLEGLHYTAIAFMQTAFAKGDVQMARAWQTFSDQAGRGVEKKHD